MPYDDCTCPDCQDNAEAYGEYSLEDREDNLRNALARMTDQEKDALRTVLDDNRVICVGSWATTGEKQSYTCLMGTVGAELLGITHDEWVERYNERAQYPSALLNETLSSEALRVPGPLADGPARRNPGRRATVRSRAFACSICRA